jgi:hypothetical protein
VSKQLYSKCVSNDMHEKNTEAQRKIGQVTQMVDSNCARVQVCAHTRGVSPHAKIHIMWGVNEKPKWGVAATYCRVGLAHRQTHSSLASRGQKSVRTGFVNINNRAVGANDPTLTWSRAPMTSTRSQCRNLQLDCDASIGVRAAHVVRLPTWPLVATATGRTFRVCSSRTCTHVFGINNQITNPNLSK